MKNPYTIAISFLGGAVIGLLAFLFIQPANTANHGKNSTTQKESTEEAVSKQTNQTRPENTSVQSEEDHSSEGESTKSSSKTEEWKEESDTSSSQQVTPHLLFYYKPG